MIILSYLKSLSKGVNKNRLIKNKTAYLYVVISRVTVIINIPITIVINLFTHFSQNIPPTTAMTIPKKVKNSFTYPPLE